MGLYSKRKFEVNIKVPTAEFKTPYTPTGTTTDRRSDFKRVIYITL